MTELNPTPDGKQAGADAADEAMDDWAAALAEQAARAAGIPAAPLEETPAAPAPRSKLRR
ncbi:hypothetical protein [Burkholderia sp. Tr-860]|uniref:hypothetical protein n=1 Tax=Burkholderia sp. Tr-860 TaxID=2608338 RepID=UPI001F045E73|nr:hypothetical protein [Burkholderia sp. Tr-860]